MRIEIEYPARKCIKKEKYRAIYLMYKNTIGLKTNK